MNLPSLDPRSDIKSYLRCPRTTCPDYRKRLMIESGQSDSGEIEIRHYCLCGYSERGPINPTAARTSSPYMAELLRRVRAGRDYGVEIPMRYDLEAADADQS